MRKFQILLFGFFLTFNIIYIVYSLLTGFDWSKVLLPFFFVLFSGWGIRSLCKETD